MVAPCLSSSTYAMPQHSCSISSQCSEDIGDSEDENDELESSDESLDCASGSDFEDVDGGKKDVEVRYASQTASKIDREMINGLLRDNPIAGE